MNKKMFGMALAAVMAAALTACGGSGAATTAAADTTAADTQAATTQAAETEAGSAAEKAELKTVSEGKLVMSTNAEFPPYEYHDADGIVGIDVDICTAIAEKLGLELEIEDIAFDAIIPEVVSGKADIGAAGMTVTEDRKENVDFSDTYAKATQVIILKEDSAVTGPDDLKGKVIGVQQGTTGDIYVTDDFGEDSVERYAKGMEAVQALSQSKVDAVIIDGETAKQYLKQVEGLKILDESYTDEEYAIAVQKGNTAMVEAINGALAELKAEGKLDEIVAKYIKAE
ncbi:polar amino acid transport system substrate-binding protein [Fusobacterium naviforme]|nr:basic amino acid ABC transporter substrate-binding protein [Fusobacterium naviforme]PSL11172.1 polar amino acid transport system substrate-binding protein [Fusobacterium naviforme]STO28547.1 Arginine-binding extracellular protein ArtP precursor [Fusobacterium naviforme]